MAKYHIGRNGTPNICMAKDGNCPFGGAEGHFDSKAAAYAYADEINEKKYGLIPQETTEVDMEASEPKESLQTEDNLATENTLPTEERRLELEREIEELKEEQKVLKGIKRISMNKEIRRREYELEGRDYDKEQVEKRERQEERVRAAEQEIIDNRKVADELLERDTLELPSGLENDLITRRFNKYETVCYRGESEAYAKTNTGVAFFGQGRYSTPDKSGAKEYGNVREVSLHELPSRPLRFKNAQSFDYFEQRLAEEHGTSKRAIREAGDPNQYITKMGYDGVTIGVGKEMIVVKYYN